MGLLSKVFGGEKEHAPLDPSSVAARRMQQRTAELSAFAAKVKDRMEIVPASEATYVFIGKPPGTFGIAWLRDGREHNLKTVIQEHKLAPTTVTRISEQLRDVYQAHMQAPRYGATIGGRAVTVTPSDALGDDLRKVIEAIAAS